MCLHVACMSASWRAVTLFLPKRVTLREITCHGLRNS